MLDFKIHNEKTDQEYLETSLKGKAMLTISQLNKGTAFSDEERKQFNLTGKLPIQVETLENTCKEFGITLFVIEHDVKVIMQLAQHIFCLAHGQLLANGTPEEIKNDKRVIDAYLGAQ